MLAQLGNDLLNSPIAQRLVGRTAAGEERLSSLAAFDVQLQHELGPHREIHSALLAALADHLALTLLPVDVLYTQPSDLGHAAAAGHQEFNQGFLLVAFTPVANKFQLLCGQRVPRTQLVDTQ